MDRWLAGSGWPELARLTHLPYILNDNHESMESQLVNINYFFVPKIHLTNQCNIPINHIYHNHPITVYTLPILASTVNGHGQKQERGSGSPSSS